METEQCNDKQITFEHSTQRSRIHERWIAEQITILAEAFGESLSPERLKVYTGDLADLDRAQLEIAFTQARHELKFFPKIAELRELAGAKAEDAGQVEADEAWQFANTYLERHGVVRYDGNDRPPLPARIEYALRRIGGLWGLNQITKESRPFMYRDFCEGYRQAPLADVLAPQLAEMFGAVKLLGRMKLLDDPSIAGIGLAGRRKQPTPRTEITPLQVPRFRPKPIPTPLTDAELQDRREMQQAARLRNTDTSSRTAEIDSPTARISEGECA